jgi:hypothetical protein
MLLLLLCCLACIQACFATLRGRLHQATLEDFGLGQAAGLNPLLPEGLLGQMHAANLLGVLQVVIEDVVADVQQLKEEQPDAATRVSMQLAVQHNLACMPCPLCGSAATGERMHMLSCIEA